MEEITDVVKILELKRYSRQTKISYKSHLIHVQKYFIITSFLFRIIRFIKN